MKASIYVLLAILSTGCATHGLQLTASGIDKARVHGWANECERLSGEEYGDYSITVVAKVTGKTAFSSTYGRPVGVLDDGNCAETSGSKSSAQIRIALAPDGYFPDAYGIHECAHALSFALGLGGHLRPDWKSWVLGWHP